jgi:hypothetical protein
LLTVTALVAIGLGWLVRQLETQWQAVVTIRQLGGTVAFEPWGPRWLQPILRAGFPPKVVSVQLEGDRTDDALLALTHCPWLREVSLKYQFVRRSDMPARRELPSANVHVLDEELAWPFNRMVGPPPP